MAPLTMLKGAQAVGLTAKLMKIRNDAKAILGDKWPEMRAETAKEIKRIMRKSEATNLLTVMTRIAVKMSEAGLNPLFTLAVVVDMIEQGDSFD